MATITTFYGEVSSGVFDKLKAIKLLVCDVDGVFSDGRIYLGNAKEELKTFHTKDGYGVKALLHKNIHVAIITGRKSQIVHERFTSLGVRHIIQGESNKREALLKLQKHLK